MQQSLPASCCLLARSIDPFEPAETVIAVSTFETLGNAQSTVAQDMAPALAAALNADSHIKARTETEVSRPSRDRNYQYFSVRRTTKLDAVPASQYATEQPLPPTGAAAARLTASATTVGR